MLAKLSVFAPSRAEAIRKMQTALGEVIITGIKTNVDYLYELINHPDFISGKTDIDFIERIRSEKVGKVEKKTAPAKKRKSPKKK